MTFLDIALDHASKGYPVFPCRQDKRPKYGLSDWENVATTNVEQIKAWWAEDDFLPAIPPGRLGLAVIDVDRHEGSEDGFSSLEAANVTIGTPVFGTSISGNGMHFWFRWDVGSVNGIYPGVDRKAQGGYVVVPYILPSPFDITWPLPLELQFGVRASNVDRRQMSGSQLNTWLQTVGAGEPDMVMLEVLGRFKPRGNQQMSINVAKVVSLAAKGHPGAHDIISKMFDIWLSEPHYSGDPEEEFQVNVRSAVEKFGEPVTPDDDKFFNLANSRRVKLLPKT